MASALLSAGATASLSFLAKSAGLPAGSHMPYQPSATRSMPLSLSVGASGRNGERSALHPRMHITTLNAKIAAYAAQQLQVRSGVLIGIWDEAELGAIRVRIATSSAP